MKLICPDCEGRKHAPSASHLPKKQRGWCQTCSGEGSIPPDHWKAKQSPSYEEKPMPTPTEYEALAQKFHDSGYAQGDGITPEEVEVLGVKIVKKYKAKNGINHKGDEWEGFCTQVYEKLTGQAVPRCNLRGRGFRSQWHGKLVAQAIREKFVPVTATA